MKKKKNMAYLPTITTYGVAKKLPAWEKDKSFLAPEPTHIANDLKKFKLGLLSTLKIQDVFWLQKQSYKNPDLGENFLKAHLLCRVMFY